MAGSLKTSCLRESRLIAFCMSWGDLGLLGQQEEEWVSNSQRVSREEEKHMKYIKRTKNMGEKVDSLINEEED